MDKVSDYIIKHYNEDVSSIRVLLNTLSKSELIALKQRLQFEPFSSRILYAINRLLNTETKVHKNEPISTLLKLFTNKKSKKVTYSRAKLQERYDYQTFTSQRNILKAFLSSQVATDRNWAYLKLYHNWDSYFTEQIRELWELHHEEKCSWLVIKYLPEDYVFQNQEKLIEMSHKYYSMRAPEKTYQYLCIRLLKNPKFVVDLSKFFSSTGYIYAAAKAGVKLDGEFVMKELYSVYAEVIKSQQSRKSHCNDVYRHETFNFKKDIPSINIIKWCMSQMGLIDELIEVIEWEKRVTKYLDVLDKRLYFDDPHIVTFALTENFPQKYKYLLEEKATNTTTTDINDEDTLADLRTKTPGLDQAIKELDLELYPQKG